MRRVFRVSSCGVARSGLGAGGGRKMERWKGGKTGSGKRGRGSCCVIKYVEMMW